jgi:hypothetical protein
VSYDEGLVKRVCFGRVAMLLPVSGHARPYGDLFQGMRNHVRTWYSAKDVQNAMTAAQFQGITPIKRHE